MGTIKDLTGTAVTSGNVTFTLQPGADTTISGSARFTPQTVTCGINGSGLVKANDLTNPCLVTNNTAQQPAGTSYKVQICPAFACTSSVVTYALGGSVDITTLTPTPSQMPAYSLVDIFQNQSIGGNKTFTGTTNHSGSTIFSGPVSASGSFSSTAAFNIFERLETDRFVDAWGADVTGVSDSAAAINNAIADAASSCSRVIFPAGTYKILSTINWRPCVSLVGAGNYPTISSAGFDAISVSNVPGPTVSTALTSVAADGQTWLVGSSSGFVVGSRYRLMGSVNSAYVTVQSIPDGTHIKTAEILPFTLTSPNKVIGPAVSWNAKVTGLSFAKGGLGSTNAVDIRADAGQAPSSTSAIVNLGIEDNIFTPGSYGIVMAGLGDCRFSFNKLNGTGDGLLAYDLSHCTEESNRLRWFTQGLRNTYPWDVRIINNDLAFGASQNFTVGLEIAGSNGTTTTDKCADNLLQGNTIFAANQGIPGSGIGGIHFNFNCHHNKVIGNTSNANDIGIYLENSNTYNTFVSNHTNYNVGYYGAGVYVDGTITTASSFNTWVNHESRFNNTNCQSGCVEGYGSGFMQISPNGSSGHIVGERVLGGMFDGNGDCGLYIKGRQNLIDGVAAQGNGTNASVIAASLPVGELCFSSDDMTKINNTISNSHFVSTTSVPQTLYLKNASSLKFVNNLVVDTSSQTNALLATQSVPGTSNLYFSGNSCQCLQAQRGWYFQGVAGQHLSNVSFVNNPDLFQGSNGFAVYEFDYTDGFARFGNKLSGSNSQVTLFNTTAEQSQGVETFDSVQINGATSGTAILNAPATGGVTNTLPSTAGTLPVVIASGTSALTTAALTAVTCGTTVTTSATGTASTDAIQWAFNAGPGTGYTSGLHVLAWVTANNVNFVVCNPTAASLTPAAATLNWRVIR